MLSLLTASVSHELIAPLKCIGSFSVDLIAQIPDPKTRYKVELIFSTSNMLLAQVKFLLDKNLLEKKLFVPHFEKHSLRKILTDIVNIVQTQANLRKITIHLDFDQSDMKFMLDQMRLYQILINLLQNAIKFSKNNMSIIL